jgi:homoserine/homoserine lactone efflux protein
MDSYLIYLGLAIATLLMPGPVVILTINNSIQRGLTKSLAGILGITLAIMLIALISATSLGILLSSSAFAFTVIKIIGAAYLIYLGIKMFRKNATNRILANEKEASLLKCFTEGFFVSLSNPKYTIFFLSIFPQFIDLSKAYAPQFILLAATFCFLVIVINTTYALFAAFAKSRLASEKSGLILNNISGVLFVGFGLGLAVSST